MRLSREWKLRGLFKPPFKEVGERLSKQSLSGVRVKVIGLQLLLTGTLAASDLGLEALLQFLKLGSLFILRSSAPFVSPYGVTPLL